MANNYFVVHNGLQVGPLSIDATTGDIVTTGNVSFTGNLGIDQIGTGDSSIRITDFGGNSSIVFTLDGVVTANINTYGLTLGANTDPLAYSYSLDDISIYFDNVTTQFPLRLNGQSKSVANPYAVSINLGGLPVDPTRYIADVVNFTEIKRFETGFYLQNGTAANAQVGSGNTIVFSSAPVRGTYFYGTVRGSSDALPAFTFLRVPFTALNIALGQ
jgi:hypothetical protein